MINLRKIEDCGPNPLDEGYSILCRCKSPIPSKLSYINEAWWVAVCEGIIEDPNINTPKDTNGVVYINFDKHCFKYMYQVEYYDDIYFLTLYRKPLTFIELTQQRTWKRKKRVK